MGLRRQGCRGTCRRRPGLHQQAPGQTYSPYQVDESRSLPDPIPPWFKEKRDPTDQELGIPTFRSPYLDENPPPQASLYQAMGPPSDRSLYQAMNPPPAPYSRHFEQSRLGNTAGNLSSLRNPFHRAEILWPANRTLRQGGLRQWLTHRVQVRFGVTRG